jgi:hypothetical protein
MAAVLTTAGHDILLNGTESWPVFGDLLTQAEADAIIPKWRGWKRRWMCLEKARWIAQHIGGVVAIGSLTIYSRKFESSYGFEYNPPFEFHSWVLSDRKRGGIIDFALPGCIEMGMELKDQYGPFLVGRKPIILAVHKAPKWLKYNIQILEG